MCVVVSEHMKVGVLLALVALSACSRLGEDELFDPVVDGAPAPDAEVPVDPTLDAIHSQILEPNCSCHFSPTPDGALSFRREFVFTELVDRTSTCDSELVRVVPSDPDASFLVAKLAAFTNGDPLDCGIVMPAATTPLTPLQLDTIRQWIADGANDFEN